MATFEVMYVDGGETPEDLLDAVCEACSKLVGDHQVRHHRGSRWIQIQQVSSGLVGMSADLEGAIDQVQSMSKDPEDRRP